MRRLSMLKLVAPAALAVVLGWSPAAGFHEDDIVLGMSAPFTGPAENLGVQMRTGLQAAFEEANRAGGVHGRRLRLVALDDGYEPTRTSPNMRTLVEQDHVVAVVGNVGTPTAVAALPIARESGTPFVGAFSGAGVLRKSPPDRIVINFRASYAEETGAMVDALIDQAHLQPDQIAFFTQRDAYGDAGFSGGVAALKRHGLSDEASVPHARYERNTVAVENALADLLAAPTPPRAVIMVGTYRPCARFVQLARKTGLDAAFLNVSFVGAASLAAAMGPEGDGVIVTQVVPDPASGLPLTTRYRAALAALDGDADPDRGSLEGYVVGQMLLRALDTIPEQPDRASIIRALEGLGKFDLGLGADLSLSPTEHQACHQVWPTVIRAGAVVPMEWRQIFPPAGAAAP